MAAMKRLQPLSISRRAAVATLRGACMAWLGLASAGAAMAQAEPVAANGLVVSADGTYVTDERLKLIWARCVEGMAWDGKTCTGKPLMLDRAEARARAVERWKAEGVNWRLPRVPELQRLFNKSAQPPGLDLTVFPAAPLDWHWTSTSDVKSAQQNQYAYGNAMQSRTGSTVNQISYLHGWAVHMRTGESRKDVSKDAKLPVRLVRPLPVEP